MTNDHGGKYVGRHRKPERLSWWSRLWNTPRPLAVPESENTEQEENA